MTVRHPVTPARRKGYSSRLHELREKMRGHTPEIHQPPFRSVDAAVLAGSLDPRMRGSDGWRRKWRQSDEPAVQGDDH